MKKFVENNKRNIDEDEKKASIKEQRNFEYELMAEEIKTQINLMEDYARMMLNRKDYHGLWDAAIDLARLNDKLNWTEESSCLL